MAGHIRSKGDGVWEVIVATGRDPVTGRYRQISRTVHGPKKAATAELARLILEVDKGGHNGTDATVAHLMSRWLQDVQRRGCRPGTFASYEIKSRLYIVPALGTTPLRKVTPPMLNDLYVAMEDGGLKASTVNVAHTALSSAFAEAVRWGWLDRNPAAAARPPARSSADIEVPTPLQVRSTLEAIRVCRNRDMYSLVHIAAVTGARRSELCGLRWSDLITDRLVEIARSVTLIQATKAYAYQGIGPTKNGKTRRVSLDMTSARILQAHRAAMTARAQALGVALDPDGYVWSREADGSRYLRPAAVTAFFATVTKRVLKTPLRFHSLRHFAVTQLLTAGIPIHVVAQRTGHDASLMLRTYAHWLPDNDSAAADHLGALMAPSPDEWTQAQAATADLLRKLQPDDGTPQ